MSQVPLLRPPLTDHQGPDDGDGYGDGEKELQGRLTCLYSKLSPQQSLKLDL